MRRVGHGRSMHQCWDYFCTGNTRRHTRTIPDWGISSGMKPLQSSDNCEESLHLRISGFVAAPRGRYPPEKTSSGSSPALQLWPGALFMT